MDIASKIKEIVLENLVNDKHFLVDVIVSAKKGPKKILVLLDGDEGISIDDCAKVSRSVSHILEEEDFIDSAYTLDVSSPGLDHPLKLNRQYVKNIGRKVKVVLNDGEEYTGELMDVSEDDIKINAELKQGKKKELKELNIALTDIKKTNVLVSFN